MPHCGRVETKMGYNKRAYGLGSNRSVIREIFEYSKCRAAQIGAENVFDFSLGNPSVPTPSEVNEALIRLIESRESVELHGYTSAQGDLHTRRAVAERIKSNFGVEKINEDCIYMTCGAAASLTVSLGALIEGDGDECVVIAPYFTEYRVFIESAGAKVVVCQPNAGTLQADPEELEDKISPRTKAVIINSPNNPSGVVYTEECIRSLCEVMHRKEQEYGHAIYLIADEPYRELVYSGVSVPYLMNYYKNTLVCYSYSKSLSLPGERIGYIAVCPDMEDREGVYLAICGSGRSLGYVCAPSLFQHAIAECAGVSVRLDDYRENRDILYNSLTEMGFECVPPDGAFYLMVKAPSGDAQEFFERARQEEILFVPCDGFGIAGYVRIAYCTEKDKIVRALPAFGRLARHYFAE